MWSGLKVYDHPFDLFWITSAQFVISLLLSHKYNDNIMLLLLNLYSSAKKFSMNNDE